MNRAELERGLAELRETVEFPATPDIASNVVRRLREDAAPSRVPRLRMPRALAAAVLGSLVVAVGAFAAVPGFRHAVLDLIDLRGATVETTTAPAPPAPSDEPDYGREINLPEGPADIRLKGALLPKGLGPPDAAFIRRGVSRGELTLVYGDIAISQFRGDLAPEYFAKLVPAGTEVERLRIDGDPAVWFSEAPHFFAYRGPNGEIVESTVRPAGNVLLVERGRLLIRIEGAPSRARAIQIARSLDGEA